MNHLKSLFEISDSYDNYIVDLWGVVHNGLSLLDGVQETLSFLKDQGKQVIFLSNAPRRAYHVASDLVHLGLASDQYFALHTSGEDAFEAFKQQQDPQYAHLGSKCYLISSANHDHLIEDCNLERVGSLDDAQFLFNTGPDQRSLQSADSYRKLFQQAIVRDLLMICVNPDISVIHGSQELLCAGSFAKSYEQMGGRVSYHGKPFPSVYESVMRKFPNPDKSRTLAVGDGLLTDIQGAKLFGLKAALVLSGLTQVSHLNESLTPLTTPDFILPGFR